MNLLLNQFSFALEELIAKKTPKNDKIKSAFEARKRNAKTISAVANRGPLAILKIVYATVRPV